VRFEDDADETAFELEPELANRLFDEGSFLILKDVPRGTLIGMDMQSWNTGDKFMGIKLIPPGIHFVYYSAVNMEDRTTAPR
jgi:A1 cistron-splicing factor AAR2